MTSISDHGLVSIGMPTYPGGAPYLKRAIDSVLGQTYPHIELVITENPADDHTYATQALCEEYARNDKRVKYFQHKENIGAVANYDSAFRKSIGEYFMWVAFDDFLAPTCLEKCVALLEHDKESVMAMGDHAFVNPQGEVTHRLDKKDYVIRARALYPRLKEYILMDWSGGKGIAIHGLWRREAIAGDAYKDLPDGDVNFSLRGLSRGTFLFVDETLFYKGVMPGGESREHEPLTLSRIVSAFLMRVKLIHTHAINMIYIARFPKLTYLERIKLILWNWVFIGRMFTRRKY